MRNCYLKTAKIFTNTFDGVSIITFLEFIASSCHPGVDRQGNTSELPASS